MNWVAEPGPDWYCATLVPFYMGTYQRAVAGRMLLAPTPADAGPLLLEEAGGFGVVDDENPVNGVML